MALLQVTYHVTDEISGIDIVHRPAVGIQRAQIETQILQALAETLAFFDNDFLKSRTLRLVHVTEEHDGFSCCS